MTLRFFVDDIFDHHPIAHAWDGNAVFGVMAEVDQDFVEATAHISPEARVALALALFEWVAARLPRGDDAELRAQRVESYWCSAVQPHHGSGGPRLHGPDFAGPELGPWYIGVRIVEDILFMREHGTGAHPPELGLLDRMVRHVLPEQHSYLAWRSEVLDRLQRHFPRQDDRALDLFDDLFAPLPEPAQVPRELFDTRAHFDPAQSAARIDAFLRSVAWQTNPSLLAPDEMAERGFVGAAYRYRPYVA